MNKLLETAGGVLKNTEFGAEATKLLTKFESVVGFSDEVNNIKIATINELRQSYIRLATSLGKGDNESINTINSFFGDGTIDGSGPNDPFINLNKDLKLLALKQGGHDTKVFDKIPTIGTVMGSNILYMAGEDIPSLGNTLQKRNLKHSNEDFGEMNKALEQLYNECSAHQPDNTKDNNTKTQGQLESYSGNIEYLQGKITRPLSGDDIYMTTEHGEFGDDRGDHKHGGVDINSSGKEVIAPYTMKIIKIGYEADGAGHYVIGEMEPPVSPPITFHFFHLQEQPNISIEQIISQGQTFAIKGNTGHSSSEHLHFEIRIDNVRQDPLKALDPEKITYMQGGKKVSFDERKLKTQDR